MPASPGTQRAITRSKIDDALRAIEEEAMTAGERARNLALARTRLEEALHWHDADPRRSVPAFEGR